MKTKTKFIVDRYLEMAPGRFSNSISKQIKSGKMTINKLLIIKFLMIENELYEQAAICRDFEKMEFKEIHQTLIAK